MSVLKRKNNRKESEASKEKLKHSTFKLGAFLASRSILRGDKWTLSLIALIMAVVFLNILFTDAIFSGITKAMNAVKQDFQWGEIYIEPKPGEDYISDVNSIEYFLLKYPELERVVPVLHVGASFINEKNKDGRDFEKDASMVEGINPDSEYIFPLEDYILNGRMLRSDDSRKILLGANLAGGYGASVFPTDLGGVRPGQKVRVNMEGQSIEYEVVGTYETKNFDMDHRAFILDSELRRILGVSPNHASAISVRLSDPNKAKDIVKDMKEFGFADYKIYDWEEKLAFGAGISKSFEAIGLILRVIGALVAGLVIFIIIFVDVLNKRRQIGILKAIGVPNRVIIFDYFIRGTFYTFLGIIFGYAFMYIAVRHFESSPIEMPVADVVPFVRPEALLSSIMFFFIAGFIGSVLPSFKEVRKKVLDLLYK